MSDQLNTGKMKETKRFIEVSEILKENPRLDDVAGWHSLQLIRQGGEVGIGYRDWKNNMPANIPNALGTNHRYLKGDLDRGRIHVVPDTRTAEVEDRIRGKGAPSPQKARAASVMENFGSTTYVFKVYSDIKLKAFKLGRSEDPKVRQDLFNLHSMPALGGLFYKRFLESL